jgi:hypothetical protein
LSEASEGLFNGASALFRELRKVEAFDLTSEIGRRSERLCILELGELSVDFSKSYGISHKKKKKKR